MVEDGSCISASTSRSGDPLLGDLQNNGGPTKTHALLSTSPAIDQIPSGTSGCGTDITTDQRGYTRPAGTHCDIGAFEYGASLPDNTAPSITLTTPADGATYLLGQAVHAAYSCTDEPGGSGLASCVGTVANGAAINTSTVGSHSFTVGAADNAGNTAMLTHSYSVIYDFKGFDAPVSNTETNTAKAGQIIALKWQLLDGNGTPVTTLSSVTLTVTTLTCDLGATNDLPADDAGASGLQNLGGGYYQYNWKTSKSYAGSCKTMHLDLGEGITHTADFKFTK